METIDLLWSDLQNREWIDEHLEQLGHEYKGAYVAVHNKGVVAVALTIPVLRIAIKQAALSMDEVTTQYFPEEPMAIII